MIRIATTLFLVTFVGLAQAGNKAVCQSGQIQVCNESNVCECVQPKPRNSLIVFTPTQVSTPESEPVNKKVKPKQ